ncbi:choline/ethanolamine kinase isoform X1 [Anopheles gambiae]|uniref:choline/ethanolamine kinase isoform X1 n=2 Tax=Anopheles gambiae TaxID=7165 RepID=UPI002AC8DD66|nr:choline/ethanolamine kinase isoform X1 [Anopheles gambiae]XP_061516790.1 choline/ethanolamine kinase isoform X1 [Anopheles gambiae]
MNNLIAKKRPDPVAESLKQLLKANSPTEMRDIAARICRDYLTGAWKTISADELQLKRISGGLSNFLYYVSLPEHHYYGNNNNNNNNNGGKKSHPNSRRGSFATDHHTVTKTATKARNGSKRARKDSGASLLEPKEVLLRIYGQTHGEHALETMLTESVVFTLLSERKLGPKLHGIFPGGRIEQYIPARALLTAELSDAKISIKVAEKMAAIHSMDIPVSKEPDWIWNTMARWLKGIAGTLETMERDRANGNVKKAGGIGDQSGEEASIITTMDLAGEVEWLRSVIESEDFPVVFCHNDLQEGNILLRQDYPTVSEPSFRECTTLDNFDESAQLDSHFSSILISNGGVVSSNESVSPSDGNIGLNRSSRKRSLDHDSMENDLDNTRDSVLSGNSQALSDANSSTDGEPELMIIDFEYCAYNYRGFDLANHFLEWTFDYTNTQSPYFYHKLDQYPTAEQQEKFITQYLSHLSPPMEDGLEIGDRDDSAEEEERSKYGSLTGSVSEEEVEQVRREVQCFTMASHLFWSLWAIVNVYQEIEFGYMEYAVCRLKQYQQAKQCYIETTMPNGGNGCPGEQTPPVDPEK